MLKRLVLVLVVMGWSLLGLGAREAQPQDLPEGRWWRDGKVVAKLNLAEETRRKLDEMFLGHREKLIALKAALDQERVRLDGLLDRDPFVPEDTMTQYSKVDGARSALAMERMRFIVGVRSLLGHERFQQLKNYYNEHHRERKRSDEFGKSK